MALTWKHTRKMVIVYKLRCLANAREYVGVTSSYIFSTANITRISSHFSELKKGTHNHPLIQKDWDELGDRGFDHEVLEYFEAEGSSDEIRRIALDCEAKWIKALNPYYNRTKETNSLHRIA